MNIVFLCDSQSVRSHVSMRRTWRWFAEPLHTAQRTGLISNKETSSWSDTGGWSSSVSSATQETMSTCACVHVRTHTHACMHTESESISLDGRTLISEIYTWSISHKAYVFWISNKVKHMDERFGVSAHFCVCVFVFYVKGPILCIWTPVKQNRMINDQENLYRCLQKTALCLQHPTKYALS